jgi:hypothetical protein
VRTMWKMVSVAHYHAGDLGAKTKPGLRPGSQEENVIQVACVAVRLSVCRCESEGVGHRASPKSPQHDPPFYCACTGTHTHRDTHTACVHWDTHTQGHTHTHTGTHTQHLLRKAPSRRPPKGAALAAESRGFTVALLLIKSAARRGAGAQGGP